MDRLMTRITYRVTVGGYRDYSSEWEVALLRNGIETVLDRGSEDTKAEAYEKARAVRDEIVAAIARQEETG